MPDGDDAALDPRVARSCAAILDATRELLLEGGIRSTTADAIAERAGVSKATLYRHWSTRAELVIDALDSMRHRPAEPDTGSLRDDLRELLADLVRFVGSPAVAAFGSMIGAAEHDAELAELRRAYAASRRRPAEAVVARAVARGELPAEVDADLLIALAVGPVFYRRLVQGRDVPPGWPDALADATVAALGAG